MLEPEERKSQPFDSGYRGYVAGVLDCDGSIFVTRQVIASREHPHYTLRISVSNTRPGLPQWFADQFGGNVGCYKKGSHKWKPEWRWACTNTLAADVLRCCLPYLVIKNVQGLLGLEFATTVTPHGKHLPQSFRAIRTRIYEQMGTLNKKGPV